MTIGEDLAQARQRSGLTVTEVSERTRIRESVIRAIERDDYSQCGGDFYARGDIRAIARVVGADPEPLIREYDAARRAAGEPAGAEPFRPATAMGMGGRHRVNWTAVLALAVVIAVGLAAYQFLAAGGSARRGGAAEAAGRAGVHRRERHRPGRLPATPAARPRDLVIQLTASQDCWVEFTTPAGAYLSQFYVVAGTSRRWVFSGPVDMRLGNPGGVRLLVDGTSPLPPGIAHPVTLDLSPPGSRA